MQNQADPRHNSRLLALQKLFQNEFKKRHNLNKEGDQYPKNIMLEINDVGNYDENLLNTIIESIDNNKETIDAIIMKLAPEWPIDNISLIDLQILRIAILEGFILKITPQKVVINEAIELSKEFSNEQTRKFISGVLGNLYVNQNKYL